MYQNRHKIRNRERKNSIHEKIILSFVPRDYKTLWRVFRISRMRQFESSGNIGGKTQSVRRGRRTKTPYSSKPILTSCYGFKIENGNLVIHRDSSTFELISLHPRTRMILSSPAVKVKSFTLTDDSLSLCIGKDVENTYAESATGMVGVDRDLRNLVVGNMQQVRFYDFEKLVCIVDRTKRILSSFRRNDARIRRRIYSKYGTRRKNRMNSILNQVSKHVVLDAKNRNQGIAFEDITGIRKLFGRGNPKSSRSFRMRMNSWPFHEIKRQVEYKAAWEGVPVVILTRKETMGTTIDCPRCGKRSQVAARWDTEHSRQLWCDICKKWVDRDVAAVMNNSRRGWLRFDHSRGGAGEAVKGNPRAEGSSKSEPAILRVDASKLHQSLMQ